MAGLSISQSPTPPGGSVDTVARAAVVFAQADVDAHEADFANPHATTKTQVGLANVTNDAQLKRAAGDINSFSATTPIATDVVLIERAAAGFAKASATVKDFLGMDLSAWTVKLAPAANDRFPIDDSAASFARKYTTISALLDFNVHTYYAGKGFSSLNDELVISDSLASYARKSNTIGDILNLSLHAAFATKAVPVAADEIRIEDSGTSFVPKRITLAQAMAISMHSTLSAKSPLVLADEIQIEDSAASFAVKRATLTDLQALLGGGGSARDPIWDAPTVGTPDDDEFTVDTIAAGAYTFTTSSGVTMVRDGALDITQTCATNHYRSSVIGSTLYLQIRQNESVLLHKTVAAALSTNSLWMLGIGFPNEPATGNVSDPTVSFGFYRNSGGALDFTNRGTIRLTSSSERVETVCNIGGGTVLSATNSFTLASLDGLAIRISHGSAAVGNACGFGFTRNGNTTGYLQCNTPQFNLASDRIGINLVSNSAGTPTIAINAIFALHYLRRGPITGWLAQA